MDDLKSKLTELKEKQKKNRVIYPWQDKVLNVIAELNFPRYVLSSSNKEPLDVRAILMRHAKQNLPVFERRIALLKEQGKAGPDGFLYYLGIVESEGKTKP